jgi:MFS family permease
VLFTVAGFVEAIFWEQMEALTPLYLPRLGVPVAEVATWTGLVVAISNAVGIPFLPLWGALADRYGRQPLIIRAFVAHLLAGILALLAGNVWVFIAGRAAMSLSLGSTGLMMTSVSERAPARRLALAFSVINSAPSFGALLGPLIGGPILDAWGFAALMLIDTVLLLAVTLALAFGYREAFTPTDSGSILRLAWAGLGTIWRSPRLRALFPALFILFSGWMLALTYVPLAVTALYTGDRPGSAVGLVFAAGGIAGLILSPLMGLLADRHGLWRTLLVAAIIEAAILPLPALAPELVSFTITWAALNGVASGVFSLAFGALSLSAQPEVRGRVMSYARLPVNIGAMIGPALGSLLAAGDIFRVFPAAAGLTALAVAGLLIAHRQRD